MTHDDVYGRRAAYGWGGVALAGALALQGLMERTTPRVKKIVRLCESSPNPVRSACYSCDTKRSGHLSRVAVPANAGPGSAMEASYLALKIVGFNRNRFLKLTLFYCRKFKF